MSLARLLSLIDGLEHSSPEGRDDAEALRWVVATHATMRDALELLAGRLCGDSFSAQDRRDAYAIADVALMEVEGR